MEKPYKGRATFNESFDAFEVIIPTKKNWFLILFLGVWLGGWAAGETFAIGALTSQILDGEGFDKVFIFLWLCAWTVGGFFAMKTFWWNLIGKEAITFKQGQVTIAKKGSLFSRPKTYDLREVKKIRAKEEESIFGSPFGGKTNMSAMNSQGGTLRFDYGLQTVKFGIGLSEAEANFILDTLKSKRILLEENE